MKSLLLAFVLLPLPLCALQPSAGPGIDFAESPAQINEQFAKAREKLEEELEVILAVSEPQRSFDNTIKALETATAVFSDRVQHLIFMGYVSPDAATRKAGQAIEVEISNCTIQIWTREDLYKAVNDYAAKKESLAGEEARLLELTLRSFKTSGMQMSAEKRASLIKMQERLANLEAQFAANIADNKDRLEVPLEDLKGMPENFIKGLDKTPEGKYIVTLQYPHYLPFMRYADNAERRRELEFKYRNRAAVENLPLLQEALKTRDESAKLLGYENFPRMTLEDRMAKDPAKVWEFLNNLLPGLRAKGEKELAALFEMKKRDDPSAVKLNSWDMSYYSDKLRKALYDLDSEEVKQYFPMDTVVDGTMKVYQHVLGVKFNEISSPKTWHESVRLFQVNDAATNRRIGFFYLDLYPREGKYTHAAVAPLITGRDSENGAYNEPVAAMMANFPKATADAPSLLPHDEVQTFFHEFGHIVFGLLTKARYSSNTSVPRDFVEAPSQMLENFVWEREVLDQISGHWKDPSKKIPENLYQKMLKARGFNKGLHYLGQASYAMGDMLLHMAVPVNTTILFNQIMEIVGLIPVQPGAHPEAGFGHIMGGYQSGYYGYLWSEVFADDIFTRFKKEGVLNPAVGMDYRKEIIEPGGARPAEESLRKFLGREPNSKAFKDKLSAPDRPASRISTRFKLMTYSYLGLLGSIITRP